MPNIFAAKRQLTVITRGPCSLSLRANTYDASAGAISAVKTTNAGLMRWGVSLIHNYLQFALKWAQDGDDEVVYKVGDGLERKSIGRNWSSMAMTLWSTSASVTD
ncbi:hypothetical protein BKA70DRAFT_1489842 [Coprinopsis sp. MPI-PUGE-AT-0042]|nr:hypothetical protein BKA70DRAFT_1489842 [Coprinopsis sp. MPI-PUGE-AT-0042]